MSPDQDFVSHSNRVLVAFLTSEELFSSLSGNPITIVLATRAIECLLLAISGTSNINRHSANGPQLIVT